MSNQFAHCEVTWSFLSSASSYDFELCEFKSKYFHQKIISQIVEQKIFTNCLGQEKKDFKTNLN